MKHTVKDRKIYILFGFYCILLIWIILFKLSFSVADIKALQGMRSLNWIPFYYENEVDFHFTEVMENLIIFIPFGLYAKMANIDNKKAILFGLIFSFLLELFQFLFKLGVSDITDLLTNTLGTAAGVYLHALLIRVFRNPEAVNRFLTKLAFACTVLFTSLLLILVFAS